jgi:hypothetical protein
MRTFLSSRKAYYFFLALAIILRCLAEINNPDITSDNSILMEAGKNGFERGSFSHTWVTAENLNEVQSKPLTMWPVGICYFIMLFNLFTHNIIYSEICFQCLGALLFIFGSVKLLRFFKLDYFYINLFLLLFAFNCSPFYYLGSTDLFTGSLFLIMVWLTLKASSEEEFQLPSLMWLIILTFVAGIVRFACIPNIVIIPAYFFILSFFRKKGMLAKKGIILLAASGILLFIFYKIFPIDSSRTGFMKTLLSGKLYYTHMQWFDAFPIKSLFFTRPIEFHLPDRRALILLYRVGLFILSFGFLFFILKDYIKNLRLWRWLKSLRSAAPDAHFQVALIFLVTFAVIVGFISLQSLTTGPESNSFGPAWMPPLWTFVYSTRYFIYLMFLIGILFFIAWHRHASQNEAGKFYKLSFSAFLAWALLYWLFINYQFYSPSGNGGGSSWTNDKTAIAAFNHIKHISRDEKAFVVVASHKEKMTEGLITNYSDAYPTDDYDRIIAGNYKNTQKLTLVMIMPEKLNESEQTFVDSHKHSVLNKFNSEQIVRFDL